MSKFESPRDAALYSITLDGWSNQSNGDQSSPFGFFARVSVSPAELAELVDANRESIESAGLVDTAELIGDFLVVESSDGTVAVTRFTSERRLTSYYTMLVRDYTRWNDTDL